ncbi:ATP-binding cassette domain-containing protein [Priestia aryabhattai]|uniref:ATP-binding cassette domain-containing protein n=1 Tax=Priestia aryabhattai TaxID=412384 RepID=UPI001FB1A7F6|nr:ABC transporter ATP-binding protein [Priestia aryabhattai]
MGNIKSDDIIFSYPRKDVLKSLSFNAQAFKITYLSGENGVGKTTWIKIATGRLKPLKGSVTFGGKSIDEVRNSLSVVLDEPPVYENLNGYDNLIALSGIRKLDKHFQAELLKTLKLDDVLMKTKTKGFSLGQRHRLAVAAALIRKPQYLILDEPTIGLDPFSWGLIKKQLQDMAKMGAAILLTGHDFHQISEIADNIVIVKDGMAVRETSTSQLKASSKQYLEILVDKPNLVLENFNTSEVKIINNTTYISIPITEENGINIILRTLFSLNISVYHIETRTSSLRDIYEEIIQDNVTQERGLREYV